MAKIEKKLKKVVEDFRPYKEENDELKSFLKASEHFDELVKSGVVSRRGNRQLSIDEAHLKQFSINSR